MQTAIAKAMNQSRLQLLAATVDYNRAQFRLFTAVGQPADSAIFSKPALAQVRL